MLQIMGTRELGDRGAFVRHLLARITPAGSWRQTTMSDAAITIGVMSGCTAPVYGHRTSSGAAACPVHGGRGYGYSYSAPSPYSSYSGYSSHGSNVNATGASGRSGGGSSRPRWSPSSSPVTYTADQVRALTPYRGKVELRSQEPAHFDLFLCHAWDDRQGAATQLSDLLGDEGVTVWFSEKHILLGQPFMREIDRGLAKSRAGLALITPSFLERVDKGGVSDKELSALLARDLLIPVVHGTTFDEVRRVSPLLGSRNGLDTSEDSMEVIATKIAELVDVDD